MQTEGNQCLEKKSITGAEGDNRGKIGKLHAHY